VYAGILNWGYRHNRFHEDADGNQKAPVSVDTGRALVPTELLQHVRVVELTPTDGPQRMSDFNTFLLSLRCGLCGQALHGYTSTKIGRDGTTYKYRKYRCAGRANHPGACQMHILSAEALEQVVLKAVFTDVAARDGERLQDNINTAIERHRAALLEALELLKEQLPVPAEQREAALIAVSDATLPSSVKQAMVARAERLLAEYAEAENRQLLIRAALDSLTSKARSVLAVLTDPQLDPYPLTSQIPVTPPCRIRSNYPPCSLRHKFDIERIISYQRRSYYSSFCITHPLPATAHADPLYLFERLTPRQQPSNHGGTHADQEAEKARP
jgi:hypothetical protein